MIKIYVVEYDSFDFNRNNIHHVEKLFDYELIDRINYLTNNPYVSNLKRYEGELKEVEEFNISK